MWQQATIEIKRRNLSIIACSRQVYIYFCSSRTSRSWWSTQPTQHHRRGCNSTNLLLLISWTSATKTMRWCGCRFRVGVNHKPNSPPLKSALAPTYSNVSMFMTSIMGQTTAVWSSVTRSSSGSNQFSLHSTCESRNVSTGAVAASAPRILDLIRPETYVSIFSAFQHYFKRRLCVKWTYRWHHWTSELIHGATEQVNLSMAPLNTWTYPWCHWTSELIHGTTEQVIYCFVASFQQLVSIVCNTWSWHALLNPRDENNSTITSKMFIF